MKWIKFFEDHMDLFEDCSVIQITDSFFDKKK